MNELLTAAEVLGAATTENPTIRRANKKVSFFMIRRFKIINTVFTVSNIIQSVCQFLKLENPEGK